LPSITDPAFCLEDGSDQQPKKKSLVSQVKSKMVKVNIANKISKAKAVQQRKSVVVAKQAKINVQASKRYKK